MQPGNEQKKRTSVQHCRDQKSGGPSPRRHGFPKQHDHRRRSHNGVNSSSSVPLTVKRCRQCSPLDSGSAPSSCNFQTNLTTCKSQLVGSDLILTVSVACLVSYIGTPIGI